MEEDEERARSSKPLLLIPSHAQVLENSRAQPPPSFFRPSSSSQSQEPSQTRPAAATSFTEAFSFVRNTDFYTAPPPSPAPVPAPAPAPQTPPAQPASTSQSRNAILVSRRQTGNPVLKFIRNVWWEYADIVPDYQLGQTTCALYLRKM